jgi:pyruvate formate lyase activating enzyme
MQIKGFHKTSMVDYPGNICSVIFLSNCNFRCAYCHNPEIVLNNPKIDEISQDNILKNMKDRKKWIDGVCITGGEPTLHNDLPEFISKIKKEGFLVKLDTNGSNPDMIKELLDKRLVDFISMDIKSNLEDYEKAAKTNVDIENIKESIDLIKNSNIDYEFRTTVVPDLHDKDNIKKIGELLKGSKAFALQNFRPGKCLNEFYNEKTGFSKEELNDFKIILEPCFDKVEIRE